MYSQQIWSYLLSKIGNEYGVAGLMGNLEAESGLIPHRLQGDFSTGYVTSVQYTRDVDAGIITKDQFINEGPNGGGYGLAQWTHSSRKTALYEKWKSGNYSSIGSIELALDYLWDELRADFPGVLNVLRSASSVREASDKVLHDFERPADQSQAVEEKRASMGESWYAKYAGGSSGGTPTKPYVPKKKNMGLLLLTMATRRRS